MPLTFPRLVSLKTLNLLSGPGNLDFLATRELGRALEKFPRGRVAKVRFFPA